MSNTLSGELFLQDEKIAIVASRFNELIVSKLVDGAEYCLTSHGVKSDNIDTAWVPGAFELPLIAQKLAATKKYDAIVCLGCVIQGATPHFDYVCSEAAKGISKVSLDYNLPVMFGVLTTNTLEQAFERSGAKAGNKGYEAAISAVEMINLGKKIDNTL